MKKYFSFFLTTSLGFTILFGQDIKHDFEEFQLQTNAKVTLNRATQYPRFIRWPRTTPLKLAGSSSVMKVTNFLKQFSTTLGMPIYEDLVLEKLQSDLVGRDHLTYQQYYQGIPVFGAKLKFHFDQEGHLSVINGVYIPSISLDTEAQLSVKTASQQAIHHMETKLVNEVNFQVAGVQLYIYRSGLIQGIDGPNHLAYQVTLEYDKNREVVYVDAHSGKILMNYSDIQNAISRTLYQGDLDNPVWNEDDPYPGALDVWQQSALTATEHVYNFFNNAFGYSSYDNADANMKIIYNVAHPSCPGNAFWDGNSTNFCAEMSSDDVVAHEWTHAYIDFTCDLVYAWQPGALNEALADIWGETIDLVNSYADDDEDLSIRSGCFNSDRWVVGEDALTGVIRDMWNPNCKGDPGKVSDPLFHCTQGDNGGVHSNSGVINHAYVLLVDGGSYNGQSMGGIGLTKAAHIFWRTQSLYLTPTSDFTDMANALEASAEDLLGINLEGISTSTTPNGPSGQILNIADLHQIQQTIEAVEMRMTPDCDILEPTTNLCVEAIKDSAFFFEDFESGLDGWSISEIPSHPGTWQSRSWIMESNLPSDRPGSAVFGPDPHIGDCITDYQNGILRLESSTIMIPSTADSNLRLAFDQYVATEHRYDGGNVKFQLNGGDWNIIPASAFDQNPYNETILGSGLNIDNPLKGQAVFTGTNFGGVGSWSKSVVKLSVLGITPGSTIKLRFELGTDGCQGWLGWYLDDIRIYSCAPCMDVLTLADFRMEQEVLFEAATTITTSDSLVGNSSIIYGARDEVTLMSGFYTEVGTTMEITSKGCFVAGSPVNDIDGNIYQTVVIGDEIWMTENLRVTKYNDGIPIELVESNSGWANQTTPAYSWYDNDSSTYAQTFGAIYNYFAVADTNSRNVCPVGWRVASDLDWSGLTDFLTNNGFGYEGSGSDIAKSLASTTGWNNYVVPGAVGNDQISNNRSGFTGLSSGYRHESNGQYLGKGTLGSWWSSTALNTGRSWVRSIGYSLDLVRREEESMPAGHAVRCIKD